VHTSINGSLTGSVFNGIGRVVGGVVGSIVVGVNAVAIGGVALKVVSSLVSLVVGEGVASHASLSSIL